MYIFGKCIFIICMNTIFPISMQKTVRAQIRPVKKNSQLEKRRLVLQVIFRSTAAQVRQTKKDEIFDSNGRFSRLFWKVKKERKLANKCFFKRQERNQNLGQYEYSRIFQAYLTSIKQPQTKLIQSSFTKIARICFGCQLWWFGFVWTKNFALQLWLFPQHQIFFEQSCVTRAFILSQTISKKHHQRLICG